jgi:hypothetical protein
MVGGGEGRDWVVEERNFGGDVGGVGGGGEEGLRALFLLMYSLQYKIISIRYQFHIIIKVVTIFWSCNPD